MKKFHIQSRRYLGNKFKLISSICSEKCIISMGKIEKIKEPIIPDTVLLGLILISFFPPKNFPKTYPPVSEKKAMETNHRKKN